MALSVFDMFSVGIGPSSSHTVGPMRAARRFVTTLGESGHLASTERVQAQLFGSLGATGFGHGSHKAVVLGLLGETPEGVDPDAVDSLVSAVQRDGRVTLAGRRTIGFSDDDVILHRNRSLPGHPNGMVFTAYGTDGMLLEKTYYSVGGGFVTDDSAEGADRVAPDSTPIPHPFRTAEDLLLRCEETGKPISDVVRDNERCWRSDEEIRDRLLGLWRTMQACVSRGCSRGGTLPGGLRVPRRAHQLYEALRDKPDGDALNALDWVNVWAMAVNEENASGGRVVTAPTNGAAGIIPAVLHYYERFVPHADDAGVERFLLTAGAIGIIVKGNASISGAEVGCQGEVGSACAMAAAGLTEVLGGSPAQAENAAEIAMEHNLGLTCDPVGGLVQIPCIERNAVASVDAINAARLALRGSGRHIVSLDKVIKTMRETGADMKVKYKETARGGLAVNVVEC